MLIDVRTLLFGVKDRANEIYKKVEDLKSIRGRSQDAILAACLYIACRQEDKPRTFKGCEYFLKSLFVCGIHFLLQKRTRI